MKLEEIYDIVQDRQFDVYDFRATNVRAYLDKLNAVCWKLIIGTLEDEPPWLYSPASASLISDPREKEAWVRTYEIAALSSVNYINNLQDESAIKLLIRNLQDDLIKGIGPARSNLFVQGLAHYKLGNLDLARQRFSLGNSEHAISGSVSRFFSYSRTAVCGAAPYFFELGPEARNFGKETLSLNATHDSVILTSGNPSYVLKYFPNYARSLKEFGSPCHVDVHLHIMSEPGEPIGHLNGPLGEIVKKAEEELGNSFSWSTSQTPDLADKRAYFACKRFLMLDDFFDSYRSVIVTDIDFEVIASIPEFVTWFENFDMAFRITPSYKAQSWAPWLKSMAGIVAVNSSPLGREMIERFRQLFTDLYFGKNFNWGIDQNILTEILDEYSGRARIGNTRKSLFKVPTIKRSV